MQVRDLDPAVNERLKAAALSKRLSYSEYLRRELTRIAERLRIEEQWSVLTQQREARVDALRAEEREPFEPLDIASDTIVRWVREGRDDR
ncbi:hypothetical protein [Leifsonia sp. NPDC058248]|uniref:hypothetical protein n=1 Tax=Leifsonia sp. NPDC058248 TaxID=3346402 RepID=UPI0036DA01BC